jgi:glycerol-3-phosphate dehydrogenase
MCRLHGKVLLGSTDIRITSPDEASTTATDIDYMLESLAQVFPQMNIDRSDIVFHFCGVRPLPYSSPDQKTAVISRDHQCEIIEADEQIHFPIYSLIGGKWTTFRSFAEQVADKILRRLDKPRIQASDAVAIGGGKAFPADVQGWIQELADETGIDHARLECLFERYGTRAREVAAYIAQAPDKPLENHPDYSESEIAFIVNQERVLQLKVSAAKPISVASGSSGGCSARDSGTWWLLAMLAAFSGGLALRRRRA